MPANFDKIDEFTPGDAPQGYTDVFLRHALHPGNAGSMPDANGFACLTANDGSSMEVWLKVDDDNIVKAAFWTEGCGTTIACGSVITEMVKGKTLGQAFEIIPEDIESVLENAAGAGCTCSKLAVDTMKAALRDYIANKAEPWRRKYMRP
jgi:nitrogen fixation protein NifU and related proteins